ncbi:hypothetical protein NDU88_004130 [Pleurodeles waltl]|uniref:Uncharacterized protein n=1 Tax=Pleurodeles waltl TaxID=8319 RepID=A0AAV7W4F0_PLEWA|nr:hypothetical protein NDU88_004130 [Pleurodeles waltl]
MNITWMILRDLLSKIYVYGLDAVLLHTVNQALAHTIRPIKHHFIGFTKQQGWVAPSGSQMVEDPSLSVSGSLLALKPGKNPHPADFDSLIRFLVRDHDYNASTTSKSKSKKDLASSDQGDDPPRKCKKKTHHQGDPTTTSKVLTFEPEDIVHPRSTLWLPPADVGDYVESHIRHGFEKEVRSDYVQNAQDQIFPLR